MNTQISSKKISNGVKKTIFFLLFLFVFLSFVPIIQVVNVNATDTVQLNDPLNLTGTDKDQPVQALATRIIKVVLDFVGVITLGMFIFGGLVWMTSGGSEEKVKKGKGILIWATLGLIVILMSYVILTWFVNSIGGII
ncbi:hypothetical protein HY750_01630 [Candidatus Kuenenbacteria bacterium]|nr:hypothetical protein [Candidatus Kuenenbacteria bacterium]